MFRCNLKWKWVVFLNSQKQSLIIFLNFPPKYLLLNDARACTILQVLLPVPSVNNVSFVLCLKSTMFLVSWFHSSFEMDKWGFFFLKFWFRKFWSWNMVSLYSQITRFFKLVLFHGIDISGILLLVFYCLLLCSINTQITDSKIKISRII